MAEDKKKVGLMGRIKAAVKAFRNVPVPVDGSRADDEKAEVISKMSPELARRMAFYTLLKSEGMNLDEIKWMIGPDGQNLF